MPARRLLAALCLASLVAVPVRYALRAQSAPQSDECKRVYGGLGLAYSLCTFQRADWRVSLGRAVYRLRDVSNDSMMLEFIRAADTNVRHDNVLIPYAAVRRVNIVDARRELDVVLMSDR